MNETTQKKYEIIGSIIVILLLPLILMFCWNYVMPYLFSFKEITYLQAFALHIMFNILFKKLT